MVNKNKTLTKILEENNANQQNIINHSFDYKKLGLFLSGTFLSFTSIYCTSKGLYDLSAISLVVSGGLYYKWYK